MARRARVARRAGTVPLIVALVLGVDQSASAHTAFVSSNPANGARLAVVQPVDPVPGEGTWTVSYRVIGEDGHPVTGTTAFVVVPEAATDETDTTVPDTTPVSGEPQDDPSGDSAVLDTGDGVEQGLSTSQLIAVLVTAGGLAACGLLLIRRNDD